MVALPASHLLRGNHSSRLNRKRIYISSTLIKARLSVVKVSPKNTSRTCPRCGFVVKTRVGRLFKCPRCDFELDRQKLASINIYFKHLRMRGFPHSNDPEKTMKGEMWAGVTLSGRIPMIWAR